MLGRAAVAMWWDVAPEAHARLATITAGPYLERLNDPAPWSRRMMPLHLNMTLGADRFDWHGVVPGRIVGLYRPAFSLTPRDQR